MPCFDGSIDVHPDTGGLMGHSVVCKLFAPSYKCPLLFWQADHRRSDPDARLLERRDDLCGDHDRLETGLTVYAGDLNKLMIVRTHSAMEAVHKLRRTDEALDQQLQQANLAQNRMKQNVNVRLRRSAENQKIYIGQVPMEVQSCSVAVMLGAVLHNGNSTTPERRARALVVRAAFFSMGSLWFASDVPIQVRRMVMISKVQGAALSGLEARAMKRSDMVYLDKVMFRAASQRAARRGLREGRGGRRLSAVPRAEQRGRPSAMAVSTSRGRAPTSACTVAAVLLEEGGLRRLFCGDALVVEMSCSIDVAKIRMQYFARSVPPPEAASRPAPLVAEAPVHDRDDEYGETVPCLLAGCASVFRSRWAMYKHAVAAHAICNSVRAMGKTNECVWCSSPFASKYCDKYHMLSAVQLGVCHADRSHTLPPVEPPPDLHCALCGHMASSWFDQKRHFGDHIPPPPYLEFLCSDDEPAAVDGRRGRDDADHRRGRVRVEPRQAAHRRRGALCRQGRHRQGVAVQLGHAPPPRHHQAREHPPRAHRRDIFPESSPVIKNIRRVTQAYHVKVQEEAPQHGRGPLFVHAFAEMIRVLIEAFPAAEHLHFDASWKDQILKLSMDDLAFLIRYCRISKCYKKKGGAVLEYPVPRAARAARSRGLPGSRKAWNSPSPRARARGSAPARGDRKVSRSSTQRAEEGLTSRSRASAKCGPSSGSRAPARQTALWKREWAQPRRRPRSSF